MKNVWTFLVTCVAAYMVIAVVGFFAKIFYYLFMTGWNLI